MAKWAVWVKRGVPSVLLGAGVVAMAMGALASPVAADGSTITTALQQYGNGTVTFSVTPVTSAPGGAWVSIMNPTTGYVFTPRTFVGTPLVAGQPTTITVPLTVPGGSVLQGFSFLESSAGSGQSVVLAAETQAVTPPTIVPPPIVPPPTVPPITTVTTTPPTVTTSPPTVPIPSVPPKGGSSQQGPVLPKTGAGPTLEIVGLLLFLAGGLLLSLRPKR